MLPQASTWLHEAIVSVEPGARADFRELQASLSSVADSVGGVVTRVVPPSRPVNVDAQDTDDMVLCVRCPHCGDAVEMHRAVLHTNCCVKFFGPGSRFGRPVSAQPEGEAPPEPEVRQLEVPAVDGDDAVRTASGRAFLPRRHADRAKAVKRAMWHGRPVPSLRPWRNDDGEGADAAKRAAHPFAANDASAAEFVQQKAQFNPETGLFEHAWLPMKPTARWRLGEPVEGEPCEVTARRNGPARVPLSLREPPPVVPPSSTGRAPVVPGTVSPWRSVTVGAIVRQSAPRSRSRGAAVQRELVDATVLPESSAVQPADAARHTPRGVELLAASDEEAQGPRIPATRSPRPPSSARAAIRPSPRLRTARLALDSASAASASPRGIDVPGAYFDHASTFTFSPRSVDSHDRTQQWTPRGPRDRPGVSAAERAMRGRGPKLRRDAAGPMTPTAWHTTPRTEPAFEASGGPEVFPVRRDSEPAVALASEAAAGRGPLESSSAASAVASDGGSATDKPLVRVAVRVDGGDVGGGAPTNGELAAASVNITRAAAGTDARASGDAAPEVGKDDGEVDKSGSGEGLETRWRAAGPPGAWRSMPAARFDIGRTPSTGALAWWGDGSVNVFTYTALPHGRAHNAKIAATNKRHTDKREGRLVSTAPIGGGNGAADDLVVDMTSTPLRSSPRRKPRLRNRQPRASESVSPRPRTLANGAVPPRAQHTRRVHTRERASGLDASLRSIPITSAAARAAGSRIASPRSGGRDAVALATVTVGELVVSPHDAAGIVGQRLAARPSIVSISADDADTLNAARRRLRAAR